MKKISVLHKTWLKNPEYQKEFAALEVEFAIVSAKFTVRSKQD